MSAEMFIGISALAVGVVALIFASRNPVTIVNNNNSGDNLVEDDSDDDDEEEAEQDPDWWKKGKGGYAD